MERFPYSDFFNPLVETTMYGRSPHPIWVWDSCQETNIVGVELQVLVVSISYFSDVFGFFQFLLVFLFHIQLAP